jgi:hypothetical protein
LVALLRHIVVPSPRPTQLAAALGALLVAMLLFFSSFASALSSLAALPAAQFACAFWLSTNPRTGRFGVRVIRISVHAVLISSVASSSTAGS